MDTKTGDVYRRAIGEDQDDFFKRIGPIKEFMIEVSEHDMTPDQQQRLEADTQPVILPADNRSKLAQQRNEFLKRRKMNKAAKKSRKRNRYNK